MLKIKKVRVDEHRRLMNFLSIAAVSLDGSNSDLVCRVRFDFDDFESIWTMLRLVTNHLGNHENLKPKEFYQCSNFPPICLSWDLND